MIDRNTRETRTAVPTKAVLDAVCTPMTRSPADTTSACATAKTASSIHLPKYFCADVSGPVPSSSTSSLKRMTSENAPTHRARFVNSGAIAEPYAATGKTASVWIDVGDATNAAIASGLTPREAARAVKEFDEAIDWMSVDADDRSDSMAPRFAADWEDAAEAPSSRESIWSSRPDTWALRDRAVASAARRWAEEAAIWSRADEIAGTWSSRAARPDETAPETAEAAELIESSAVATAVEVPEMELFSAVRSVIALPTAVFCADSEPRTLETAGSEAMGSPCRSASSCPFAVLMDEASPSRPPTAPAAPWRPPSRAPPALAAPAAAWDAWEASPSRLEDSPEEKDDREVRASETSWSAVPSDASADEAAPSIPLRAVRAVDTDAFAPSICGSSPSREARALPSPDVARPIAPTSSDWPVSSVEAREAPASETRSERVLATVATKAELIWLSRAVAPARVIFGATALFFSFT